MRDILNNNKKEIIIISIIVIITLMIFIIQKATSNQNIQNNKLLKNEDYIIEKEIIKEKENVIYRLPYINLNNKKIEKINNSIFEKYYLTKETKDSIFDYKYTQIDDFISIIIMISTCENGDSCKSEYISYNLDLKNNKVLNNKEVLEQYNLDLNVIESTIKNKLNEYYNYELSNRYIDNSITFEKYLSEREIENFEDVSLYVDENNKIKIYKTYTLSSGINLEEEFIDDPFMFEIN